MEIEPLFGRWLRVKIPYLTVFDILLSASRTEGVKILSVWLFGWFVGGTETKLYDLANFGAEDHDEPDFFLTSNRTDSLKFDSKMSKLPFWAILGPT